MPITSSQTPAGRARRALALGILVLSCSVPARGQGTSGEAAAPAFGTGTRRVPEQLNFANGLFRDRRYAMAAEEYERFLKDASSGPDAIEARFGLANARLFQGQYELARHQFEEFLKAVPDHRNASTAWFRIGETAYMLGDLPEARQALETFLGRVGTTRNSYLEIAWPYLGDVCLRMSSLPEARRAYEKALEAYPEGRLADRARFGLARTMALQNEPDAALKVLATMASRGGRDWNDRVWLQIGLIEAGAGRDDKAVEAFETLEKQAPRSPLVAEERLNRAGALVRLGRAAEAEPLLRALMAEAPRNLAAQAAFELGTTQLSGGRPAEALETLDSALKRFDTSPMAPALMFRAAEAELKLGRADVARARFLKAAEVDPKDPWADDALVRAARLALEARDTVAARDLAGSFVARFPESPLRADARLIEARAAMAAGHPKEAIALLTDSLAHDQPGPETAQAQRYYLGLAYRADGQADKSSDVLDALAKTPAASVAADARYLVGQGHVEAGRFAEAIAPLEAYLAEKPKGDVADSALAHLAQARLKLGEPDAAARALAQLAERFPESKALAPTRLLLAEAALDAKQHDRAAELFQRVVEAGDPGLQARARLGLGWALLDGGKPAEAAEAFAALIKANPDDPLAPEAALARGRALRAAGKADEALAAYALVAEKYPRTEQGSVAALARARLLVEVRRPAEAAAAFEQLLKDHPDPKVEGASADALLDEWGWTLVDAGKAEEADRVFARLLKEFPDSPCAADARFNLAESAYQAKNYDEVVALLAPLVAEGSKASPRLIPSALYRLGRTQAERGDWPAAAQTLDRLIAEHPDSPYRREARFLQAEVALKAGDAPAAESGFAALAAEPPAPGDPEGFVPSVRRRRIQALVAQKKWKEALEAANAFRVDVPQDPYLAEVDYARGRALQSMSPPQFEEARAAYQSVIDARRGGDLAARAQLMRGETFFHEKKDREALREFLKVDILYDAPTWQAAALLEAGKVYERLDQWADAAEIYERLCAKFPDDPSAAEAKPLLDAARKHRPASPGIANTSEPSSH